MPQVNANIPVSVLRHRPDISAKEWRVRESLATVDIRRAEYAALSEPAYILSFVLPAVLIGESLCQKIISTE